MKALTRIFATVVAAFVSLLVAAPALAATGHDEKVNFAEEFSSAGQPVNVVAILITGAVLLIIVLALSTWLGNMFKPAETTSD